MFEIWLDLINTPSWNVIYIGILLGVGVNVIYNIITDHSFYHALALDHDHYANHVRSGKNKHVSYTVHDWIARIIRRKEGPSEDAGDHHLFLVR